MTKNFYIVPVAIILAGAMIGGGLAYGLSRSNPSIAPNQGPENAPSKSLSDVASQVGLDVKAFDSCITQDKYAKRIEADSSDATKAGAQGTPYSVVIDKKGNTAAIPGALPYEQIKSLIDQALAGTLAGQKITLTPISTKDHIRGKINAPVTIVEYSDFSCPFCKQFHPSLVRALSEYDGKVRWVYRHFPLINIHPHALSQAKAAECAGEQGKFWEYADALFEM